MGGWNKIRENTPLFSLWLNLDSGLLRWLPAGERGHLYRVPNYRDDPSPQNR